MMSIRPRTKAVLGCTAVLGCLLVPAPYASFAAIRVVSLFAPVQRVFALGGQSLALGLDMLAGLRSGERELRRLKDENASLKEDLARATAQLAEKDQLLRTFKEFESHRQGLVACEARILGEGTGAQSGLLFLDRGLNHDVRPGMMVVAGHSAVGTVRSVAPNVSSALWITSRGSNFDGLVVSTGERGIVTGQGDGTMKMKYVTQTRPRIGDQVVTHGGNGMVPPNFLLGTVTRVTRVPGQLAYDVVLTPARDLDRLTDVLAVRPAVTPADLPASEEAQDE